VAYGVTHHLTFSLELPYLHRDRLREGEHSHSGGVTTNEVVALGNVSGIGDATLLAKYRLTEDEGAGFAIVGGIKLPTGSTNTTSLEGERLETEHQPGTGSWDPIVGASAAVPLGGATLNRRRGWMGVAALLLSLQLALALAFSLVTHMAAGRAKFWRERTREQQG